MRFRYPVSLTTIGLLRMDTIPDRGWDPVLEAVGRVVRLSIRGTDLAMRETDSQITILLPHTDVDGARRLGELLTARISELEVNLPTGSVQIEAVAGSATLLPESIPSLFDHAPVPPGYFEHAEVQLRHRASSLLANATLTGPGTSLSRPETDWPLD
jgi:GGDEF domain-containing protein